MSKARKEKEFHRQPVETYNEELVQVRAHYWQQIEAERNKTNIENARYTRESQKYKSDLALWEQEGAVRRSRLALIRSAQARFEAETSKMVAAYKREFGDAKNRVEQAHGILVACRDEVPKAIKHAEASHVEAQFLDWLKTIRLDGVKIRGIGEIYSARLRAEGIRTAYDFVLRKAGLPTQLSRCVDLWLSKAKKNFKPPSAPLSDAKIKAIKQASIPRLRQCSNTFQTEHSRMVRANQEFALKVQDRLGEQKKLILDFFQAEADVAGYGSGN